jgi:hypothetical protein
MRRFTANHRSDANYGVEFSAFRNLLRRQWQLKRARNFENLDRGFVSAEPLERVDGAFDQFCCQKIIPMRRDDRKAKALSG